MGIARLIDIARLSLVPSIGKTRFSVRLVIISGLVELNWILLALCSVSIKVPGESSALSGAAETKKACWKRKKNAGKRNMISIYEQRHKIEQV